MIRQTLETLKNDLQAFMDLKNADSLDACSVVLSNILDQKGETSFTEGLNGANHYLVMTLINISEESHLKPPPKTKDLGGMQKGKLNPELNINLFLLFSSYSSQYETSLAIISDVLDFFQSKSYFDKANTPSLPDKVKRIVADLQNLSFEQQNYLWGLLGAKYMPSVVYKFRTITITEENITEVGVPIQHITF